MAASADEISLKVKKLPEDILSARRRHRDSLVKAQPARSWEEPLATVLNKATGLAAQTDQLPLWNAKRLKFAGYTLFGLTVGAVLIALAAVVFGLRSQRHTLTALKAGFSQLTAAYEAGNSSPLALTPATGEANTGGQRSLPQNSGAAISPTLAALPDESLLALLADCYWTNQDTYAAYLWRRIPTERKLGLLKALPLLDGYAAFVRQLPEQDQGFEQDPSYLNPLPLWHLDTAAVTELVRDNPVLLRHLSPLRLSGLDLRPSERLSLAAASTSDTLPEPVQISPTSSAQRPLPRSLQIQIRSDADEREVLAIADAPLSLIAEVPSLGWLLKLPEAQIAALLQPYSARDLASVWAGPEEVLARLGQATGDKKRELILFQATKTGSSRTSPVFIALHRAAVAALSAATASGQQEDPERHAA